MFKKVESYKTFFGYGKQIEKIVGFISFVQDYLYSSLEGIVCVTVNILFIYSYIHIIENIIIVYILFG